MITKGYVISKSKATPNKYLVRIPIFEASGIGQTSKNLNTSVSECTLSYNPGTYEALKPGDCVFISFENNDYSRPIILGKLYTGVEPEATGFQYNSDLRVEHKATLPANTTIGDVPFENIQNYFKSINTALEKTDLFASSIQFKTNNLGAGKVFFDDAEGVLQTTLSPNVTMAIGIDTVLKVYNDTAADMYDGQVVYRSGTLLGTTKVRLSQADNHEIANSTIGIVTEAIPSHGYGFITRTGYVGGILLDPTIYSDGEVLYLSPDNPGEFTNQKPVAPDFITQIGYVNKVSSDSVTADGQIYVDIIVIPTATAAAITTDISSFNHILSSDDTNVQHALETLDDHTHDFSDLVFDAQVAKTFFAAPATEAGIPTFREIVATDIPVLNQNTTGTAANVTGIVAIANGGTGQTTKTDAFDALAPTTSAGDIIYHNGTDNVRLIKSTDGKVLKLSSGLPAWGTDNDTLNTAGSTNTSSKIYLVGATSQTTSAQTYSDDQVYATDGILTAKDFFGIENNLNFGDLASDMKYNGIPEDEKSKWSLSYNATSRVFTLTLSSASYYYVDGKRFDLNSGAHTWTAHTNTTGVYYFYFDNTGTKITGTSVWDIVGTAQVAYVIYNSANDGGGAAGLLAYELHGAVMSSVVHKYEHLVNGTELITAGGLSGYTTNVSSAAAITWSLAECHYADEDIFLTSPVQGESNYNLGYFSAANVFNWRTSSLPIFTDGTNIQYNPLGSGLVSITTNNTFVNYYIALTNQNTAAQRIFIFPGQAIYTTLAAAEQETPANFNHGSLPFQEIVFIYRITFQRVAAGATEAGKSQIAATPKLLAFNNATLSTSSSSHSLLSNRDAPNSHPAAAISYDNAVKGLLSATDVQSAIDELAEEKVDILNDKSILPLATLTLYPDASTLIATLDAATYANQYAFVGSVWASSGLKLYRSIYGTSSYNWAMTALSINDFYSQLFIVGNTHDSNKLYYRFNGGYGLEVILSTDAFDYDESNNLIAINGGSDVPLTIGADSSQLILSSNGSYLTSGAELYLQGHTTEITATTTDTSNPVLAVKGPSGVTANLQEWLVDTITKAVITKDGYFGIGTITPAAMLSINGNGEPGAFSVTGLSTGGNIATFRDKDGENIFTALGSISGGNLQIFFGDKDGAGNGTRLVIDEGNNVSYFEGGNVGIGDTNPFYRLTVADNGIGSNYIHALDRIYIGNDQIADVPYISWAGIGDQFKLRIANPDAEIPIYIDTQTAKITADYFIANNSIGIGATPTAPLEINVSSATAAAPLIKLTNTNEEAYSGAYIYDSDNNLVAHWGYGNSLVANYLNSVAYFGTIANKDLILTTNNTEKVRVTTAGNLGINTTTPGADRPSGAASSSHWLEIKSASTGVDTGILLRRSDAATGFDIWSDNSTGANYLDNRWSTGPFIFRTTTGTTPLELMRLTSTGLGIGTNSPNTKLSVTTESDTDSIQIRRNSTDTGAYATFGFRVSTTVGVDNFSEIRSIRTNTPSSTDSDISVLTRRSTVLTEALRIKSDGSIGIGTATPGTINSTAFSGVGLHVVAGTQGRIVAEGTGSAQLLLNDSGATANQRIKHIISDGGTLYIGKTSDAGTGTQQLVIRDDGTIGIGTSSPAVKLNVITETNDDSIQIRRNSNDLGTSALLGFRINTGNDAANYAEIRATRTGASATNDTDISFSSLYGVAFTQKLILKASGNVGIGTDTPYRTLHVSGANAIFRVGPYYTSGGDRDFIDLIANNSNTKIVSTNELFTIENTGGPLLLNPGAGNIGIGTSSPGAALDISDGLIALTIGADLDVRTRTNNTAKYARFGAYHYTNDEQPLALLTGVSNSSDNLLYIGGGSGIMNTATRIAFYTAANNTTLTGTERMRIDSAGSITISSFTSAGFVKTSAAGLLSVDTTTYATDASVVHLAGNETITGIKTFNAIPAFNGGTTGSSAPFTVDSTYLVTNLNADLLDGQHGSYYASAVSPSLTDVTIVNSAVGIVPLAVTAIASTTANLQEWKITTSLKAAIDANGTFLGNLNNGDIGIFDSLISNQYTATNNIYLGDDFVEICGDATSIVLGGGTAITRNSSSAGVALTVNQQHASSTGNIVNFQFGGANKLEITKDGFITQNGTRFIHNYGTNNLFVGRLSANFTLTGTENAGIGNRTLESITSGSNNTAVGNNALYTVSSGVSNTAVGYAALYTTSISSGNTAVGHASLYANTLGAENTAIGYNAGRYYGAFGEARTTGNYGIYVGSFARASANGTSNEIVIGYNTIGQGSNSVVLGNTDITKTILRGNVGIGTESPSTKLEVSGAGPQYIRVASTDNGIVGIDFIRGLSNDAYTDWQIHNNSGSLLIRRSVSGSAQTKLELTDTEAKFSVNVGINQTTPTSQLHIVSSATNKVGLIVDMPTSATANIQEWKVNGSTKVNINANGQLQIASGGSIYTPSINNISSGTNSSISLNTTGTTISRNIADANTALIVNQANASSTGRIIEFFSGGSLKAWLTYAGTFYANAYANIVSGDNSVISLSNSGTTISRNIADADTTFAALKINNQQGNGDIVKFQYGGSDKLRIDKSGNIVGQTDTDLLISANGAYINLGINSDVIIDSYIAKIQLNGAGVDIEGDLIVDGNVGIGVAEPTAKLDVGGDITHTGLTMSAGTNVDQMKETTFTSALTTSWTDVTGVSGTYLLTGSYIVQIESSGEYYTGNMSWYSGATSTTVADEIELHRAGPAASAARIYARVLRQTSGTLKLQLSASASIGSHTIALKFRRTM